MSQPKRRHLNFIISKPVDEVKAQLLSYEKRSFLGNIKIEFTESQDDNNNWNVTIYHSKSKLYYRSSYYWVKRFSGQISQHTEDSTKFAGQIIFEESYQVHFLTNIMARIYSILLFFVLEWYLLSRVIVDLTLVTVITSITGLIVFIAIGPYMVRGARALAYDSDYRDNEIILKIIRDLAPPNVII